MNHFLGAAIFLITAQSIFAYPFNNEISDGTPKIRCEQTLLDYTNRVKHHAQICTETIPGMNLVDRNNTIDMVCSHLDFYKKCFVDSVINDKKNCFARMGGPNFRQQLLGQLDAQFNYQCVENRAAYKKIAQEGGGECFNSALPNITKCFERMRTVNRKIESNVCKAWAEVETCVKDAVNACPSVAQLKLTDIAFSQAKIDFNCPENVAQASV